MASDPNKRTTIVCTYGENLTLLTTGGGQPSEHLDCTPEEAILLAEDMIRIARMQIERRSES